MAFLTLWEIIDMIVMTVVIGYIFSDVFIRRPLTTKDEESYDPLKDYSRKTKKYDNLKYAIILTAPALILHELGHKFVAMFFGMTATFNAAYIWLGIALLLKLMNFGFIFLVPAYVSWAPATAAAGLYLQNNPWVGSTIAFAGPAVNGILWLVAHVMIKSGKYNKNPGKMMLLVLTRRINGFLFIFNLIPIPGFDGWHVFSGLWQTFV